MGAESHSSGSKICVGKHVETHSPCTLITVRGGWRGVLFAQCAENVTRRPTTFLWTERKLKMFGQSHLCALTFQVQGSMTLLIGATSCLKPLAMKSGCVINILWHLSRIQNAVSVANSILVAIVKNCSNAEIASHIAAQMRFGQLKNLSNMPCYRKLATF